MWKRSRRRRKYTASIKIVVGSGGRKDDFVFRFYCGGAFRTQSETRVVSLSSEDTSRAQPRAMTEL